uniref:Putative secreted protein n=1 Tax=Amblyomma cajennense TaxID=34607 RepID=A0A023FBX7_AMBCJ
MLPFLAFSVPFARTWLLHLCAGFMHSKCWRTSSCAVAHAHPTFLPRACVLSLCSLVLSLGAYPGKHSVERNSCFLCTLFLNKIVEAMAETIVNQFGALWYFLSLENNTQVYFAIFLQLCHRVYYMVPM